MKRDKRLLESKYLTPLVSLLKKSPQRLFLIVLGAVTIFFLPGQNRYQRQPFYPHPHPVRALTTDYVKPNAYPKELGQEPPPPITAKAAVVIDLNSKTVLFEKNPQLSLAPASTTKLMTAWVARQIFDLDEVVIVPPIRIDGSSMGLVPGEKITVGALLQGLLVNSANDAAVTLAQASPGGPKAFISLMNAWARRLELNNTQYTNTSGVDEPHHYTSARDLARLATAVLNDPVLSKIVTQETAVVHDIAGRIAHPLRATNLLLGQDPNVKGIKTGWTNEAGGCLVALWSNQQRQILSVVLASANEQTRFSETKALFGWTNRNYSWETAEPPASIQSFVIAGT